MLLLNALYEHTRSGLDIFMHNVGLNEYIMKVFPSLDEVTFTYYIDV